MLFHNYLDIAVIYDGIGTQMFHKSTFKENDVFKNGIHSK